MSKSAIECRECGSIVATRHHSGSVRNEPGARFTLLPNGQTEILCECGHRWNTFHPQPRVKTAPPLDRIVWHGSSSRPTNKDMLQFGYESRKR